MKETKCVDVNRRDFLKNGSTAVLLAMAGGVRLVAKADEPGDKQKEYTGPKLKVGVIGLGSWGREIVSTLQKIDRAQVAAVCDNYPAFLRRCGANTPGAAQVQDYRELLKNPDIAAVVIATPTHQHNEIALAAIQAGKHVYCEAPLANRIDDARQMASAARARPEQIFQSGLQLRSDPQRIELLRTFRTGALGEPAMARAQWHKKQSWRQASPKPEREKEINWRLDKAISLGLLGEIGIHHLDQCMWYLNQQPTAIGAHSRTVLWNDGRDVPDTVQAVFEFPNGICMTYDATLANSFDGEYEVYYGSDSAVLLRQSDIWLFKEVDAKLLGWEVYFPKQQFHKETGIVLKVGASKSVSAGDSKSQEAEPEKTPLFCALETFVRNAGNLVKARQEFIDQLGDDPVELKRHLATQVPRSPAAGWLEGFRATVLAIKANEAVLTGTRVPVSPELFGLG